MTLKSKLIFLCTCAVMLGMNVFIPVHFDEGYYWEYSRHLSMSYVTCPPMAAYLVYFSTQLLGNTAFAVKLPSVLCFVLADYVLYRFTRTLFNQVMAEIALIIFLFLPFVTTLVHCTTPDSPLVLFWVLTLYSFYIAIAQEKNGYFYLAGVCAGFLLLSKYTGVLLLGSLFCYLALSKEHRKQFFNPHLYFATLIALLIFSPVILWNYQHEWAGFLFQWHHGVAEEKVFSWFLISLFIGGQLAVFSPIFFCALMYVLFGNVKFIWGNSKLFYLFCTTLLPLMFFAYHGIFTKSEANWPIAAYISGTVLLAYWIVEKNLYRIYISGMWLNFIIAFVMLIMFFIPGSPVNNKFYVFPGMMKQAALYIKPGDIVFAEKYTLASVSAFYFPEKIFMYVLGNARDAFWSPPCSMDKIRHAWFIRFQSTDNTITVNPFSCVKKTDLSDNHAITVKKLSLYDCYQ